MHAVRRFALAAVLAAGAGCYNGPPTDDPSSRGGSLLPRGIATPSPGSPSPGPVIGIFSTGTPDDPDCCWLGATASFPVRVRAGASRMQLATFIPDIAPFQARPQGAAISVDAGPKQRFDNLGIGRHVLEISFPPARRARFVRVAIEPAFSFVPIKARVAPDGRTLSLYLRLVRVL
ncbi:MAG: hypothetical protein NVS4B13_01030 [Candidatus Elarobacter sp.]